VDHGASLSEQREEMLRERVAQVQDDGYAESVNDSVDGIQGVAVPIISAQGGGALSVSGPSERFTGNQVSHTLGRLRHAAEFFADAGLRLSGLQYG
jgi:DNA-binding IclR family transcriptional regulator